MRYWQELSEGKSAVRNLMRVHSYTHVVGGDNYVKIENSKI